MAKKTHTAVTPREPVFTVWCDECQEMREISVLELVLNYLSATKEAMDAFECCNGEITLSDYRCLIEQHTRLAHIVHRGVTDAARSGQADDKTA